MPDERRAPLRRLSVRLAAAAQEAGKPQYVVEKDYALGYLLAGIAAVPALYESLVFKGGTCLRKAYFPGYRFSEDLDFTARKPWGCEALLQALKEAVERMKELLQAYGPFEVVIEEEGHSGPHQRGQCAFQVRVQFPWMRSPQCSLKVEVTEQEPLLLAPVVRRLLHEFPGEPFEATSLVYPLEEIAAEKLRALLQSRQHLEERGWVKNRPRDLYDLRYLRQQRSVPIDWQEVRKILPDKAAAYGITYEGRKDFLNAEVLEGIKRDWNAQLENFVTTLPPFDECHQALQAILDVLFEDTKRQ